MSYLHKHRKLNNQPPSLKRQSGVVIVVALFLVALVAAMSYYMMSRLLRDTQRTTLITRNVQAEFYAQGSIVWAVDQLRNDWEQQKPDKLIDVMPIKSPANEENGYIISSTIDDMQSRFNLNNVSTTEGQAIFKRLIQLVQPGMSSSDIQAITAALIDWITPGVQQGELTRYYTELPQPYRAAHRLMQSASELRLVKGVTPVLYNALQPFITALPNTTPVNVQTAPAVVLAALSPTMPVDAARTIEQIRRQKPFTSTQAFLALDIIKNHAVKPENITVTSSYFLVETQVSVENQRALIYTLMERVAKERKAAINILWQSKGVW